MNKLINKLYDQHVNDLPDTVEEAYKKGLEDMFDSLHYAPAFKCLKPKLMICKHDEHSKECEDCDFYQ